MKNSEFLSLVGQLALLHIDMGAYDDQPWVPPMRRRIEMIAELLRAHLVAIHAVARTDERGQGSERAKKSDVLADPILAAALAPQDPPVYCRSCDHTHVVGTACWFRETAGASGIPPPPPEKLEEETKE